MKQMIYPSKYNGINFSGDFNRSSENYNFGAQRKKNVLPYDSEIRYLSFFLSGETHATNWFLTVLSNFEPIIILGHSYISFDNGFIYFFSIAANVIPEGDFFFKCTIDSNNIYSEIYEFKRTSYLLQNEICKVIASNNDNRHGYLTNQAFGFFKVSNFKSDIFLNKKTEYNYSYSRKKILSSENQIGKRFTFLDLTMYNANLLKWLCNCENLSIDGVDYKLISDFTELEMDLNSEILNLQADFVEVNQSFFANGSSDVPTNIFTNQFFN